MSQAWREFHKDLIKSELIYKTFHQVELFLAVDESKDHELWIKNISDVQIEDWTKRLKEISNLAAIDEDEKKKKKEKEEKKETDDNNNNNDNVQVFDSDDKEKEEEKKDNNEVKYVPETPPHM